MFLQWCNGNETIEKTVVGGEKTKGLIVPVVDGDGAGVLLDAVEPLGGEVKKVAGEDGDAKGGGKRA